METFTVNRTLKIVACAVVSVSMLGGCSWLRTKFGENDAYKKARQERPLEVPPDLDVPNTGGSLVIPEAAGGAASSGSAPRVAAPGDAAPAIGAGVGVVGEGLRVADTADSTFRRVGLALERSGIATVRSSDASAGTYDIQGSGTTTQRAGWLKRAVTFGKAGGKKVSTSVSLTVRVTGEGDASVVTVEGGSDEASKNAARDVLSVLRERLS